MKMPPGLTQSETNVWKVFDAFQRIDIKEYLRRKRTQDRLVVKCRFRFRLAVLRRAATREIKANEIN